MKKAVSVRLERETTDALERIASERSVTPADLMRLAIEAFTMMDSDGLDALDSLTFSETSRNAAYQTAIQTGEKLRDAIEVVRKSEATQVRPVTIHSGMLLRLLTLNRVAAEASLGAERCPPLFMVEKGNLVADEDTYLKTAAIDWSTVAPSSSGPAPKGEADDD